MATITWINIQSKMVDYFSSTFQIRPDGLGGWGRLRGQPISIVNTVEALLALREMGKLDDFLSDSRHAVIKNLLHGLLTESMEKPITVTRYLAYGAIGLAIVGEEESELQEQCVERLLALAQDGGWPIASGQEDSFLVPTFHAMFALNHLGITVDPKHYEWLISHKRSDNLCSFRHGDTETSFGASCLVLYLLVQGGYGDRINTRDLASAVRFQLNKIFPMMLDPAKSWVSIDPQTNFRIYGYGLALRALHQIGMLDVGVIDIASLINAISISVSQDVEDSQKSVALSLDSHRTWVPAVLELAVALRTVKDSFDPFAFYSELEREMLTESDYQSKLAMVEYEHRILELRQKVLNVQERELLKRENIFKQLDAYKESLPGTSGNLLGLLWKKS
ncbi:MAG: hypothetical protein DRN07_08650 [Thermoplasmata archaeon]|nr:MAG: hypothetical protein DRN07_08650 [Thermoplasmata archaeon]